MNKSRREVWQYAVGALALPLASRIAAAQNYPTRPVHLVVTVPAGGSPDIIARLLGDWLSQHGEGVRVFTGHIPPQAAISVLRHQLLWTAALVLFGRWLLARGLRRIVVQGGWVGNYTNPILTPGAAEAVKKYRELSDNGTVVPDLHNMCWPEPPPFAMAPPG